MADWNGTARTNYFKALDIEGLRKSLEPFEVNIHEHHEDPSYVMLSPMTDDGGFATLALDEEDEEIEFAFETHVMPFAQEGEVVVLQECGAEKLHYVTGFADAFIREGDQVRSVGISMNSIYTLAATEFGVSVEDIARCSYSDLPENKLTSTPAMEPKG